MRPDLVRSAGQRAGLDPAKGPAGADIAEAGQRRLPRARVANRAVLRVGVRPKRDVHLGLVPGGSPVHERVIGLAHLAALEGHAERAMGFFGFRVDDEAGRVFVDAVDGEKTLAFFAERFRGERVEPWRVRVPAVLRDEKTGDFIENDDMIVLMDNGKGFASLHAREYSRKDRSCPAPRAPGAPRELFARSFFPYCMA